MQSDVNALLGQTGESVPDQELDEELARLEAEALPAAPAHDAIKTAEAAPAETVAEAQPDLVAAHADTAGATRDAPSLPSVPTPSAQAIDEAHVPAVAAAVTSSTQSGDVPAAHAEVPADQVRSLSLLSLQCPAQVPALERSC